MDEHPNVLVGDDIQLLLFQAGIHSEPMSKKGLKYIRRVINEDTYYFITNWSGNTIDDWIDLNQQTEYAYLMDPMYGQIGLAQSAESDETTQLRLQLDHGAGMIIRCTDQQGDSKPWKYIHAVEESIPFTESWKVTFHSGGPVLPDSYETDDPGLWTHQKDETYQYFSGVATYSTTFQIDDPNQDYLLDLGEVNETASLSINGQQVATLVGPSYKILLDKDLLQKENQLNIEISNKMANRIIRMDRDKVFWKKAYNVNFPPRLRENFGWMGLFDASEWTILPSGLAGPVTLSPIEISD